MFHSNTNDAWSRKAERGGSGVFVECVGDTTPTCWAGTAEKFPYLAGNQRWRVCRIRKHPSFQSVCTGRYRLPASQQCNAVSPFDGLSSQSVTHLFSQQKDIHIHPFTPRLIVPISSYFSRFATMAAQETNDKRLAGLTKLFNGVIHGNRELKSAQDGNRFLEALCAQEDASKCVENLIAAPQGLAAMAKAFRFSSSSAFLNGPGSSALRFLSAGSIKQLYGGHFLHRIIEQIVQPPTFWNTIVKAHHACTELTEDGTQAFAWLLLEILYCRSEEVPDVREVAEQVTQDNSLMNHSLLEVRNLGHKIKHVLESTSSDAAEDGPGGRHDNDFADFRKVKILPTPDEFVSADRPFYRRGDAIESVDLEQRGLLHLDNQFRLLREDLVGELRNDYQIAIGAKSGRGKVILTDLQFAGIDCGIESRRKPCSVKLRCNTDIPQMQHLTNTATRKKYVLDNKNMLKHQSLGCLVSDGNIVAFATVDRDEDKLAQMLPILVLRIVDNDSFSKVLTASKSSKDLCFVQVATAVFAYEPILRCLQNMTDTPLQEQLLDHHSESHEALSGIQPVNVIANIAENFEHDLKDVIGTSKSVELDKSQAESLLTGLTKRVSLIQGPPGKYSTS